MQLPSLLQCLKQGYNLSFFKRDILSGLTVSIVAIPLSIAFAIASGATPMVGLLTAIIGGFIVSMLGGSKYNISGPAGAFICVIFSIISQHGYSGLLISTFMAGMILILMSVLKLGNFVEKIPNIVVVGFSLGLGIDIFSGQVPDFFGFHYYGSRSFISKWFEYFNNIKNINFKSIIIGIITLSTALIVRKRFPKAPAFLIAIIISYIVTHLFHLDVETIYSRFGYIKLCLPKIHYSILDEIEHPTHILQYVVPAFTIAMLAGIEALLAATIADKMKNTTHNASWELFGQSIANMVLSLFGCLPVAGTTARTIVNVKSNAKSPLSGMFHSVFILLFLVLFAELIVQINMPTIAGILFIVSIDMMSLKKIINIAKTEPKRHIVVVLSTALCVISIGIVYAIIINTILYFILEKKFSKV